MWLKRIIVYDMLCYAITSLCKYISLCQCYSVDVPKQLIQICFYFLQYATTAKFVCHPVHTSCAVCFATLSTHANFSLCSLVCICCAILCFAILSTNTALCIVILSVYTTVKLCHLVCACYAVSLLGNLVHICYAVSLCFHLVYICHHFFIAVFLLHYYSHFLCLLRSVCVCVCVCVVFFFRIIIVNVNILFVHHVLILNYC